MRLGGSIFPMTRVKDAMVLTKLCLKPTSLYESINFIACPSRGGTGREGVEMLDARCWIKKKSFLIPSSPPEADKY